MSETMERLLAPLPDYLGGHMLLSAAAIAIGLVVSLPLGVWASRRQWVAEWLLGAASILQTIPTLALLALMVPILGGEIGYPPALVALTLYSFLPILANTITGIRGVDPALVEAARGLGMTDWQLLVRVQLPLAAPVLLSGVRTATVIVVGTATLATPVGGLSLGNYIFAGLNMLDMNAVIFGCVITALLAIVLDQLVHLLELAVKRRDKRLAWIALACLGFAVVGSLFRPIEKMMQPAVPVVATGQFTEQHILSEVIKARLDTVGAGVDQRRAMGETIQFLGLKHDRIDCCINYTGNIWVSLMNRDDVPEPTQMYDETKKFLEEQYDVKCLGKLGFQNNYVLALPEKVAQQHGIETIDDLKKHPGTFILAGDEMFFDRLEWRQLRKLYDMSKVRETKSMDQTLLYGAVESGKVQVITAYSSDGRIDKLGLRVLRDPKNAFPSYDAILIVSRRGEKNALLRSAVDPLIDRVDIQTMKTANFRVDGEQQSPAHAAKELLAAIAQR